MRVVWIPLHVILSDCCYAKLPWVLKTTPEQFPSDVGGVTCLGCTDAQRDGTDSLSWL